MFIMASSIPIVDQIDMVLNWAMEEKFNCIQIYGDKVHYNEYPNNVTAEVSADELIDVMIKRSKERKSGPGLSIQKMGSDYTDSNKCSMNSRY